MKGITTLSNLTKLNITKPLHYFRLWRELRLYLLSYQSPKQSVQYHCTISVYEGNYDIIYKFNNHKPIYSFYCTISVYEGNYDFPQFFKPLKGYIKIALFPFMKGITTRFNFFKEHFRILFKLHYFRLWRELRPGQGSIFSCTGNNCTISVYEGNYD